MFVMQRNFFALLLAAIWLLCAAGCTGEPNSPTTGVQDPGQTVQKPASAQMSDYFTDRDLEGIWEDPVDILLSDGGSCSDSSGVTVEGNTVTVTRAGTYRVTGKLSDGQLRVSVGEQDKVQLVLDGVQINCSGSAALYILSGDKVFLTLKEHSENTLRALGEFVQRDENTVDAAIFSKSDVTINGSGSMTVDCETGHGIVSKDDLKITGGSITVCSARQGVTGKNSIRIASGSVTVTSGADGLHSKHDTDPTKGYICIFGGMLRITAGSDGMDASGEIRIQGGSVTVLTGEGSESVIHTDSNWGGGMMGGWPGGWGGTQEGTTSETSCKAIKAGTLLTVTGGSFQLDSQEDALHSNGDLVISGGEFSVSAGDDAIHADQTLSLMGGTVDITKSYEGIEGNYITISGGDICLLASDDGINAAGGNDSSGMAGPWGQGGGFGEATDAYITISGGSLVMNAGGDGIDSNGALTITGGTVYLDGPTNSGNGALDYAGEAKITGGTVIALGAAGMASNFGTGSTQGSIMCNLTGTAPAGTEVSVKDSSGKVLASYTSEKRFQNILISAPGMVQGQTYTVTVGTTSADFTLDSIIYGSGDMGGMGGGPGGPGGMGGGPGGMGGGPGGMGGGRH